MEYEVLSTRMIFSINVVGVNEQEVINDLVSQVGVIKVLSIYRKSGIDRITQGIRTNIVNGKNTPTKKRIGRPRLPDE